MKNWREEKRKERELRAGGGGWRHLVQTFRSVSAKRERGKRGARGGAGLRGAPLQGGAAAKGRRREDPITLPEREAKHRQRGHAKHLRATLALAASHSPRAGSFRGEEMEQKTTWRRRSWDTATTTTLCPCLCPCRSRKEGVRA